MDKVQVKATTRDAHNLLIEGAKALAIVESNGIKIDTKYFKRTIEGLKAEVRELRENIKKHKVVKTWKKHYGSNFNLNSREQLGNVLFNIIGYKSPGLTKASAKDAKKKQRHKTDEESLKKLDIDFVQDYLKIAKLDKARTTYCQGIMREVHKGKLHPVFNLHTTQTYRSSSDSPNFQNIPIRTPLAAELVRRGFIPRRGGQLVEVDYSRAEICCAACYHHDPAMIEYIEDESKDMHRDMAGECFMLPKNWHEISEKKMMDKIRYTAKNNFVFPEFYGSEYPEVTKGLWNRIDELDLEFRGQSLYDYLGDQGIEERGNCRGNFVQKGTFEAHIKKVERSFWKQRFKVYDQWRQEWWKAYKRTLSFQTLTGFLIRGVLKRNEVINYPVQGSAFHWLLWSLIQIQKAIKHYNIRALIVGQIHDSIVADVHKKDVRPFVQLCQDIMTEDIKKHWPWIIVPLKVEADVTPVNGSWYEKEEYVL